MATWTTVLTFFDPNECNSWPGTPCWILEQKDRKLELEPSSASDPSTLHPPLLSRATNELALYDLVNKRAAVQWFLTSTLSSFFLLVVCPSQSPTPWQQHLYQHRSRTTIPVLQQQQLLLLLLPLLALRFSPLWSEPLSGSPVPRPSRPLSTRAHKKQVPRKIRSFRPVSRSVSTIVPNPRGWNKSPEPSVGENANRIVPRRNNKRGMGINRRKKNFFLERTKKNGAGNNTRGTTVPLLLAKGCGCTTSDPS